MSLVFEPRRGHAPAESAFDQFVVILWIVSAIAFDVFSIFFWAALTLLFLKAML